MSKKKETPAEMKARKAASTTETRYQGKLNAKRTRDLHKVTAAKANKRRNRG
jgi:hypothetical protein